MTSSFPLSSTSSSSSLHVPYGHPVHNQSCGSSLPVSPSTSIPSSSSPSISSSSSTILYASTRGGVKNVRFPDVVLGGLAPDKGLYVPQEIPRFTQEHLSKMANYSFVELAHTIMLRYIASEDIPSQELKILLEKSTINFRAQDVTPVRKLGNGHSYILELFHGPTFAFKDVALQFLGNLFEYFLLEKKSKGEEAKLTILGATSGDTGSAAIYGLRGKRNVNCFILYPEGRVSPIQERQMTTVEDENIHCLAIKGTFDDAQKIVKDSFQDVKFRDTVKLGAVNSINWARVLAQITYYFHAYFFVIKEENLPYGTEISFSVPTGNFGDILAGYYAKQMGLPIGKLVVATNSNDILHRFFTTGEYHRFKCEQTIAPSMDISISSNFERYLYMLIGCDDVKLRTWMSDFERTGKLTVKGELLQKAQQDFLSGRSDGETILQCIKNYYEKYKYTLCPHTATGLVAVNQLQLNNSRMVCLATAHPAKFPEAITQVIAKPDMPPTELKNLNFLETRSVTIPNSKLEVKKFILKNLQNNAVISLSSTEMEEVILSGSNSTSSSLSLRYVFTAFKNIFHPKNQYFPFFLLTTITMTSGVVWSVYNTRGKNGFGSIGGGIKI